jgi:hypothetical protein
MFSVFPGDTRLREARMRAAIRAMHEGGDVDGYLKAVISVDKGRPEVPIRRIVSWPSSMPNIAEAF